MSFPDCGGVQLPLDTARDPQFDHPSSIVCFRVADIDASYRTMPARSLLFEQKPALTAPMPDLD